MRKVTLLSRFRHKRVTQDTRFCQTTADKRKIHVLVRLRQLSFTHLHLLRTVLRKRLRFPFLAGFLAQLQDFVVWQKRLALQKREDGRNRATRVEL